MRKIVVIAVILIAVVGAFFFSKQKIKNPTSLQTATPSISEETSLLVDVAVWYPSAPWSEPKATTEQTQYGALSGESINATVSSPTASIPHFEMADTLKQKGFEPDLMLSADGPGSSQWGYKKTENGQSQIMVFSYKTEPSSSNPNEPLQFNCPCKVNVSVFVSTPFSAQ